MDDPVKEIPAVVLQLTQGSPSKQAEALEAYFTSDAAFIHPFCRVPSFANSRKFLRAIFRWYKIMSPHIDIDIISIAFDKQQLLLYLSMSQTFRIFLIPFHKAPVNLVTVLHLRHDKASQKYYIQAQEDLYQTSEFIKFLPFTQLGNLQFGAAIVWLFQVFATVMCFFMMLLFWPITWIEEKYAPSGWLGLAAR